MVEKTYKVTTYQLNKKTKESGILVGIVVAIVIALY